MAENNLKIPRHVAIIMDGNGRWAAARGLARAEGHRAGSANVERVLDAARAAGVEFLTLYAFSTENWKRSPQEVGALMQLLGEFLDSKRPLFMEKNVRLLTVGRTDDLPFPVRNRLLGVIESTRNNTAGTLILALSYGGRAEIVDAARRLASAAARGDLKPEKIDETAFAKCLYHPEIPDPDLMIRTSGEMRISNFMLWQLAYAELYVTPVLWPDFDETEFNRALEDYSRRDRRFGGRK
ncbi:MAG: polyprenyl diphosphate synthase [Victivallaceae bacterium]|nr:polyprenyl diphosphate synthase [Victivallaceae bacterium]